MLQTFYYRPRRLFAPTSRVRQQVESAPAAFRPQVDIVESAQQYQLILDLPGIDPQAIDVTEEKNILTIEARRQPRELQQGENLTRQERKTGSYKRQFDLPEDVDADSIQAHSQHGVLTVTIARRQTQETQRKIEINQ